MQRLGSYRGREQQKDWMYRKCQINSNILGPFEAGSDPTTQEERFIPHSFILDTIRR